MLLMLLRWLLLLALLTVLRDVGGRVPLDLGPVGLRVVVVVVLPQVVEELLLVLKQCSWIKSQVIIINRYCVSCYRLG